MRFLRRKIYLQLKKHLGKQEISLILGPRQAGKTTLMLKLVKELEKGGKRTAYFNLDVIEDRQYFQTQHLLLDRLEKTIGISTWEVKPEWHLGTEALAFVEGF